MPECQHEVCITCSDTAVAVTVVRLLDDGLAIVETGRGEEEVSVALVRAAAGDTVLVHAKEAIAVVGGNAMGQPATGSMESLYPFLYSGTTDLDAVLEQVRQSTVAKAGEITELRRVIGARDGARLMASRRLRLGPVRRGRAAAGLRQRRQRHRRPAAGRAVPEPRRDRPAAARARAGQRHLRGHGAV